ncbi:MAG: 3-phosphoshikimate 1-carboxyvinyltransferase [Rubrobacteraceae bacterium]
MRPVSGVPGLDFTVEDVRGEFPEELEIKPLDSPVDATVRVPGSKSVTNRALIVAALADGESTIRNPLLSDDSYWLMHALARLGFPVRVQNGDPGSESIEVRIGGKAGSIPTSDAEVEVYVGNAGTAARFLPPFLALGGGEYRLDGTPRMRERPVQDLVESLRRLGGEVRYGDAEGRFPLLVSGTGLGGGIARVEGGKSSQFLSGLLMAAPYAKNKTTLEIEGRLVSRPYVGITTGVMKSFGVDVESKDKDRYEVSPGVYAAREYEVEPDASAASYFMAAAAATGGRVKIPGLGKHTSQGDLRFLEVLEQMGCRVETGEDYVEVHGPRQLRGVEVDMNDFSDTMMTLAAIAPFAGGDTIIKNVGHTRHQETDRISAVAAELRRIGAEVEEQIDFLRIIPKTIRPAAISTYEDHRMAMAFAVTGLVAPGIRIKDPGCVTKTFPEYFRRLESLR